MRKAGLIMAVLLICGEAHGYTRSRDPDNDVCLWWQSRMMTYYINETCSVDVQLNNCLEAVQAAFDVWNGHACTDFEIVYGGTTARTDVGYDQGKRNNINLVVWLESNWKTWDCPPEMPVCREVDAIALTTTTYDVYTGEIVDADVEMNGEGFVFSTATPTDVMDIHNTLAHEVGHMLGLDHSEDQGATMWRDAKSGETKKRDLSQDDIDGLCFIYPRGEPTPEYYISGGSEIHCRLDPPGDDCGCHDSYGPASSRGGSGRSGLGLLLIGIALLGYRIKSYGRQES